MGRVEGKTALITGAGSGLGRAFAERLAQEGASLLLTDIDEDAVVAVAKEVAGNDRQAMAIAHDVTSTEQWENAIKQAETDLGKIDILINNAGITIMGDIESISLEDLHTTFRIDVDGVFLGTKLGIGSMKKTGGGSIINISSIAGQQASSTLVAYNAAKAAVTMITKSAALHCAEQKYDIRCNSVHPGAIHTPIIDKVLAQVPNPEETLAGFAAAHPVGRLGQPDEVASVVLYLASDESSFATGAEFNVDGGATA